VARPLLEVADILNQHGDAFLARHRLSHGQLKVMGAIRACRTAALGGRVARCDACDHLEIAYNSCLNRHCPKCQGQAARAWLEQRQADLLPVPTPTSSSRCRPRRIASPEMFPNVDLLPHLKCSRPGWGRGDSDEAGEHGDAG